MQIKIKDFIDDFAEGVKNTIQKGKPKVAKGFLLSMGLVTALSGCQMTQQQYESEDLLINKVSESLISERPTKIDETNLEKIFTEGISGIYQHPLEPNEVITLVFTNDKGDAEDRIENQLEKYNLSGNAFNLQYNLLEKFGSPSVSHYKQNILGFSDDINVIKMNHYNYYDENQDDNGNQTLTFNYLKAYQLYYHEVGHSLKYQDLNFLETIALSDSENKTKIGLETSAEFVATVKTHQMVENSEFAKDKDLKSEFTNFIENKIETARLTTISNKTKANKDEHLFLPGYAVYKQLSEESPELLLNISDKNLIELSAHIMETSQNFDYKDSFISAIPSSKINAYVEKIQEYTEFKNSNPTEFFEIKEKVENPNLKKILDFVEKHGNDMLEGKILSSKVKKMVTDLIIPSELQKKSKLDIGDYSVNYLLGDLMEANNLRDYSTETIKSAKTKNILSAESNILSNTKEMEQNLLEELSTIQKNRTQNKTANKLTNGI